MPRGGVQKNRAGPQSWQPRESGAGGVPVADPAQVAAKVAQALARRFPGLQWKRGRLTAPLWRKRPPRAAYERMSREAMKAHAQDPRGGVWDDFQAAYPPSKSEILQLVGKAWGLSYATVHRLTHGTSQSLSWRTIRCVHSHLTEPEWEELKPAIFGRPAREFFAYIESECDHLRQGRTSVHDYRFTRPVRAEVESFGRLCRDSGMPPGREELARLRVFGPLVAHRALRRARWLTHPELLQIVRLGYRREKHLLTAERELLGRRRTAVKSRRR